MKIVNLRIDKIKEYPLNNKIHPDYQLEAIGKSILNFGFLKPLLVDEDYVLLAGHGAFLAGKRVGMLEFPCIVKSGLTEDKKKAYRIADNKIADLGSYDFDAIAADVAALVENDFDISVIGMSDVEIENLLRDIPAIVPADKSTNTKTQKESLVKEHTRKAPEPTTVKENRVLIAGDIVSLGGIQLTVVDADSAADADWLVRRWENRTGEDAICKNGMTFKELSNARG